jgi:S-formylglutathione hydrolase FrmB
MTFRMMKTATSSILLLTVLCSRVQAHRPIFSEKAATSPETAVLITQPWVSQVIYREITATSSQVWLAFDANDRFELFLQVGVPVVGRLKDFRPAMMVVGPGFPEAASRNGLAPGAGAKDFRTDDVKEPRFFHEPFTGTDSWILRSETIPLPKSGRYYAVAYVPSGQKGKLWLSMGKKEVFGFADLSQFGSWKKRIRAFHEIPEPAGGLGIPILTTMGSWLKAVGSAGSSTAIADPGEAPVTVRDDIRIHTVETPYQNGRQEIRVLLPDSCREDKPYRVLYVLPVEKDFEQRYGYGLGVFQEMKAQDKYDLIMVQIGFEKEPWYGDHAADPPTRQASYVKEFVVPFIERHYSTKGKPEGRLLLGFSKSGWGAFSLILRYPEFFGYAASWDAPMFFGRFRYGMESVYGTLEQLNAYRPDLLVSRQKRHFQKEARLVLAGEQDWGKSIPAPQGGSHTVEMHALLMSNGVKHDYNDSLSAAHRWNESWMAPTLDALVALTEAQRLE